MQLEQLEEIKIFSGDFIELEQMQMYTRTGWIPRYYYNFFTDLELDSTTVYFESINNVVYYSFLKLPLPPEKKLNLAGCKNTYEQTRCSRGISTNTSDTDSLID